MKWNGIFALVVFAVVCAVAVAPVPSVAAQPDIVADGEGRAQIVIADQRPRMATLAALELQYYIEKISGARLPIATDPSDEHSVTIYVGRSEHTESLGVTDEGLKYGAYRIVSGDDWLVLLGHDFDYTPPEPWPRSNNDSSRAREEWDKLTQEIAGASWNFPFNTEYKKLWNGASAMTERYGEANAKWWPDEDFGAGFWSDDEGGTLNAVYAFLRSLGVRWYMPGEVGEVAPEKREITLASFDKTVEPDFGLRSWFWYNYSSFPFEDVMWARRLGLNGGEEVVGGQYAFAHGHVDVHGHEAMKEAHPEYYALRGGQRDTEHRGYGMPCYSSKGLEEETVRFARFMYDQYDRSQVSIWPVDGFRKCQCEQCVEKSPSELVWEFVDRVARELYKTHPDRLLLCGAYTPYRDPPDSIEKFSPNVVVDIANRGRPTFTVPERWTNYREKLELWRTRLAPKRIIRGDNNRYSLKNGWDNPDPFPVLQAHATAKDLRLLKGISLGEISEQSQRKGLIHPGVNHLGLYVQAQYLWDAEQDLDPLLDEYFELFYGPVSSEMKAAFRFAERAYTQAVANALGRGSASPDNVPLSDRIRLVRMLQSVRDEAGESVYAERIQVILDELQSLDELRRLQQEQADAGDVRKNAPVAVAHDLASAQTLNTYDLKEIDEGRAPEIETTFRVGWDRDALVFAIRCQEPDMENLYAAPEVWTGDSVAILLETPNHAYYQIEINPDGQVYDRDRGSMVGERWRSQVEVHTARGDDSWRVKARIPIVSPAEGEADPNHNVAGPKPSKDDPWYFNLGRVRVRGNDKSAFTFSPTGAGYHVPEKFGKLEIQ